MLGDADLWKGWLGRGAICWSSLKRRSLKTKVKKKSNLKVNILPPPPPPPHPPPPNDAIKPTTHAEKVCFLSLSGKNRVRESNICFLFGPGIFFSEKLLILRTIFENIFFRRKKVRVIWFLWMPETRLFFVKFGHQSRIANKVTFYVTFLGK